MKSKFTTPLRRSVAKLMAGLLAAGLLAACSPASEDSGSGESKEIDAIFYTRTLEYYTTMVNGMKAEAKDSGYTIKDSYADFDVAAQQDLFRNAIARRPAAILLAPLQPEAWTGVLKEASDAGVPVLILANTVPEEARQYTIGYVGFDAPTIGRTKAEFIAKELNGQGTVGVIHFVRGHPITEDQRAAYTEVFKKFPGIKVVEGDYATSGEESRTAMENFLSTTPKPDAMFFDIDDNALGSIPVLQEHNLGGIVTASSDGTAAAVAAIKDGKLSMDISVRPYATGQTGVKTVVDYLENDVKPEPDNKLDLLIITPENVADVPPEELGR